MTRYKVTISYDGSEFSGFQRQPHARTVQEEIEKTLERLNSGQVVRVHGAGRTDAKVHAYGQVIHFDMSERSPEKLRFALDTQTPEDIDVVSVEIVDEHFHSRYTPHIKTYEFLVDIGKPKNPMMRRYASHFPYPVDLEKVRSAIAKLEGKHDFTGFTASGSTVENKVRTITEAKVVHDKERDFLIFTFTGNGFLYKQIRNMVGTLMRIGNDRFPISQIDRILDEKDRQLAGVTFAPNGLYLKEIRYDK